MAGTAYRAADPFEDRDDDVISVRPPLAMEVVSLLENKIITRQFAPGERLIELDLCQRYGISRSPMREALRLLEASGLVVRRPRFGVRVAPMTLEDLDHVYACRVPLEALAAHSIASLPARHAAVAALSAHLDAMRETFERSDFEACFRANVHLTDALHRECGNPVLRGLLGQVNKPALRYRHWAYTRQGTIAPLAIRLNAEMVAAIAAGDAARADAVTRELVIGAWNAVRDAFAAEGKALALREDQPA